MLNISNDSVNLDSLYSCCSESRKRRYFSEFVWRLRRYFFFWQEPNPDFPTQILGLVKVWGVPERGRAEKWILNDYMNHIMDGEMFDYLDGE